jgi:hypothetical protein
VLANCDDSPSKDAYLARGWATRRVSREALHDLFFNPGEGRNVIDEPEYAEIAADLRDRLERWMVETDDPLLRGAVPAPPGALINTQDQISADDEPIIAGGDVVGAASGA